MAIDFKVKDVIHRILAKFIHAYLPAAFPGNPACTLWGLLPLRNRLVPGVVGYPR
jgi:hypothetical protein